jgi:hypothetical protein
MKGMKFAAESIGGVGILLGSKRMLSAQTWLDAASTPNATAPKRITWTARESRIAADTRVVVIHSSSAVAALRSIMVNGARGSGLWRQTLPLSIN